jgi:hypothetical protein
MTWTEWRKAGLLSVVLMLLSAGMVSAQTFMQNSLPGVDPGKFINSAPTEISDALTLSPGISTNILRQPPLLSSRYIWNGQTFLPYIGAGLSHGDTTDTNGTLWQEERVLHEPLGRALVPNEVQLGVRIPF